MKGVLPSVGYISQADTLLPWRTVLDNVALAMELRGVPKAQRQETARSLMARMGLAGFEHSYPRELSGGMKKRAAIARVLAIDPDILMMDEPFAPLDALTRQKLQDDILSVWETTGCTILYVTHDLTEAITLADRVVLMSARARTGGPGVSHRPAPPPAGDGRKVLPPLRGAGKDPVAGSGDPAASGGSPMTPKKSRLSPGVWTVLCLLLALCLWEWAAAAGHVNDYFFSRPSALWAEFLELVSSGLLAKHLSVTLQEAGLGLLFGGLFGTLAGWAWGWRPESAAPSPPCSPGSTGLPKLALGPVFIIWFGLGLRSKVIMSALMGLFHLRLQSLHRACGG